jgi:hypothetical protein
VAETPPNSVALASLDECVGSVATVERGALVRKAGYSANSMTGQQGALNGIPRTCIVVSVPNSPNTRSPLQLLPTYLLSVGRSADDTCRVETPAGPSHVVFQEGCRKSNCRGGLLKRKRSKIPSGSAVAQRRTMSLWTMKMACDQRAVSGYTERLRRSAGSWR